MLSCVTPEVAATVVGLGLGVGGECPKWARSSFLLALVGVCVGLLITGIEHAEDSHWRGTVGVAKARSGGKQQIKASIVGDVAIYEDWIRAGGDIVSVLSRDGIKNANDGWPSFLWRNDGQRARVTNGMVLPNIGKFLHKFPDQHRNINLLYTRNVLPTIVDHQKKNQFLISDRFASRQNQILNRQEGTLALYEGAELKCAEDNQQDSCESDPKSETLYIAQIFVPSPNPTWIEAAVLRATFAVGGLIVLFGSF